MPSFDFLDKLELFIRTGQFPVNASKSSKTVTRAASKHFLYKDGCLWRSYRGRLLRAVRSEEEIQEILTRYHDNNSHAGRERVVRDIMLMYYWVGVTQAVKNWIKACAVCQNRTPNKVHDPPVQFCLVYGCDVSSYICPEVTFHRFPKEAERRQRWLAAALRDEGSLRKNSYMCSRHFEPSCFTLSEDGQLALSSDAVPTITPDVVQEDEVLLPSDEDLFYSTEEGLLRTCAAADSTTPSDQVCLSGTPVELREHQYCLPASDLDSRASQTVTEFKRRKALVEPSFTTYNHIARYLSHRVLPMQGNRCRGILKRMAKRFGLIDGELMYTRVSPPVRVPRSREEVNAILKRFHDNRGHRGQGLCQQEITKHFYWASMTRDLARWISSCQTCLSRTKRRWLRCSVYNCSNCCGPVERTLGLTFHKFPLDNVALLTQWLEAVGRPHWHPRLRSSICSMHFTEDCLDRSGEKVVLRPGAVPTLMVNGDSVTQSRGPTQPAAREEAFFAKYDAVQLYLSTRTYPRGLNYVEKNTFRRFCKKFTIKDGELYMGRGERMSLVLRNQQQVEAALVDYHNELNHLNVNKCLRLLKERYFWKTMKSDVVQWINDCFHCSSKSRKKPDGQSRSGGSETALRALHPDSDSATDSDTGDVGGEEDGGDAEELTMNSLDAQSVRAEGPPASEAQKKPSRPRTQPHTQQKDGVLPAVQKTPTTPQSQRLLRRRSDCEPDSSAKSSSCGLEPVVAPSTKPWPVFTIANSTPAQTARLPPEVDSPGVSRGSTRLQARAVIQQCCQAKVKTKPALDGTDAQWAEIEEGMVVYVCFFHGATEDVTLQMANSLMTTKLFRKDTGHMVSLLDLPGSVLFIPQESLLGEPASNRRMQFKGGCEQWWGAQLFSNLVLACRELMAASAKCSKAGMKVEQGVYRQKQELVLNSVEPFTLLLEF
ncbi:uncharacterized protein LOC114427027 [Parambassis ranga]|uniref:THAP domain-containing protein 1 n=1 Tax=Parambassis ranga TaxID=210632 RepID=A0A6P7HFF1_9TELE|nr:uncharacterized protein LOC114427027 [Parambassis ranga]XP_028250522.1 uncharacterized protein LOC114427027 [Parambassis ranga]